jgi:hypothetical protein
VGGKNVSHAVGCGADIPDVVRGPLTRAELAEMPDDGRRYEIIDGVLIVSAAAVRMHQPAAGRLFGLLGDAYPQGSRCS